MQKSPLTYQRLRFIKVIENDEAQNIREEEKQGWGIKALKTETSNAY